MSIRKKLKGGFTLVELMIVVAIIGVLAVLAVYGVRKYIANAKTAEARSSLGAMGKAAIAGYESERMAAAVLAENGTAGTVRQMCANAGATVPSAPGSVKGMKYQSSKADWARPGDVAANAGFPCLKFEMSAPQYFMYDFKGSGSATGSMTALAYGDLNGDDVMSTFSLLGSVSSGRLLVAPSIGENSPEE